MRELKIITLLAIMACGTPSDTGKVVTESGGEETGELDEGEPCAVGENNHLNNGTCYCDEGFAWCDANTSLDCCPE